MLHITEEERQRVLNAIKANGKKDWTGSIVLLGQYTKLALPIVRQAIYDLERDGVIERFDHGKTVTLGICSQ
jgi:predicted transcriptional regulator